MRTMIRLRQARSHGGGRIALAILAAGLSVTPGVARGQGPSEAYPELSREQELRLAMSAGPLAVSVAADIYAMSAKGFERVVEGSNGFACLVVRSAVNRSILAPHCLNPAAAETVLPAMLREGELQAQGLSGEAVDAELKRQWANGELPLPSGPAYAYMLSGGQQLGSAGTFKPHFMLYVPYITNAAIGGDPANMQFPFVGPVENHPLSTVVIIMEEFVDPASVVLPRR